MRDEPANVQDEEALLDNTSQPNPDNTLTSFDQQLVEKARGYARKARSENTRRAYQADWNDYVLWCERFSVSPLPPAAETLGLYITDLVETLRQGRGGLKVSTINRRLAGIAWNARARGFDLDRKNVHLREVLAGISRAHGTPPERKAAILADDLRQMLGLLSHDLIGLRDRAILLVGFAGGLRRSEIVGLDCGRDQTQDGLGWVDITNEGLLITLNGKTGWREVEIGLGSSEQTCPKQALEKWLAFSRIAHGPIFRGVGSGSRSVQLERLNDKHVARLVKRLAEACGIQGSERQLTFSAHSLRAGLATSAQVEERYVQRQLGHASAEMTRRYQRQRDRFKINLTKASGL